MSETLADLIQRRKRELGLTWRELGARAGEAIGAGKINLHRYGQPECRDLPSARIRTAIAAGIDADPLDVFAACVVSYAQTSGYEPHVVLDRLMENYRYKAYEHDCGQTGEFSLTLAPEDAPSDDVADIPRRAQQVADTQGEQSQRDKPDRRKKPGNTE